MSQRVANPIVQSEWVVPRVDMLDLLGISCYLDITIIINFWNFAQVRYPIPSTQV